jgi:hypothetical protein
MAAAGVGGALVHGGDGAEELCQDGEPGKQRPSLR